MAEGKTTFTGASVEEYIASRASARQLADCRELMAMFERISGHPPRMWGPSIVGYDVYQYTYESGRSGEAPIAAFAIRGREFVVYLSVESADQQALLARLGKHRMSKCCLYFRQLADLDQAVLEKLIVSSIADARRTYG